MELLEDILLQKQSLIQVIHKSVKVVEHRSSSQVRFFNFLSGLVETSKYKESRWSYFVERVHAHMCKH